MRHSATRAMALLEAMNRRAVSRVGTLALETGISKPSVVRLLGILIEDGYVQRSGRSGSYLLTDRVLLLSSGFRPEALVERVAKPLMEELTARIEWPAALGIFDQGAMVVRCSTISSSPLSWYRTTLHQRLPLLGSAMGLVFLAFAGDRVRAALLADVPAGFSPAECSEERFERIRLRGCSVRLPTDEHPTLSLSVPVVQEGRALAALSVTLYGRAMSPREAEGRYLATLRATADEIRARVTRQETGREM